MPVEDCPLHNGKSHEKVQPGAQAQPFSVRVRGLTAMVWITVTIRDPLRKALEARYGEVLVPFPAMVDTGFNESLLIHEWHLEKWAGILLTSANSSEPPRWIHGRKCPGIKVDVWLHCLHRSIVRPVAIGNAIKLNVSSGALQSRIAYSELHTESKQGPTTSRRSSRSHKAVPPIGGGERPIDRLPDDVPWDTYPHIPLIGMKALQSNKLTLAVDGERSCFSLQP